MGLDYIPSQSAMVLVERPRGDLKKFYERFENEGIFLSQGSWFGDKYILFPIGREEQNARNLDLLGSMLKSQVMPNWRIPAGGGALTTPAVVIQFKLKPDGQLDGEPRLVQGQTTPQVAIAAEAAIRAIKNTVPFQMPPEKYEAWKSNSMIFDASKM